MAYKSTAALVTSLLARLAALTLPAEFGSVAAFDHVRPYDLMDLDKAIEELFTHKNRVCLLIVEDHEFDNQVAGRNVTSAKTVRLSMLIADRDWKTRELTLMGDPEATPPTPGVLRLTDIVTSNLLGQDADTGQVLLPETGELFALEGVTRDNLHGRIAWRQPFTVAAGMERRELGRAAVA